MQKGDVVGGRFAIEAHAGSGGMGHVYRALDRQTGETVALKVLLSMDAQGLARFTREAETLAALRLPGVVRYVAHGAIDGGRLPYLGMQWLAGETLSERLDRAELTVSESVMLARRVATTLGMVHRLGIVHRDLKPSNLLLIGDEIERVTLIDFGVARATGPAPTFTTPGSIVGTPGYMAPEQARGRSTIDARADVFALGCVLFKCLTGRPAFAGSGLAVLAKVLLEEPPRLRAIRDEIPEELEDLVTRMLSKSPLERPPDGEAVAAELAALEGLASASRPAAPRAPELTANERRVMCLVVAHHEAAREERTHSEAEEQELSAALQALARRFQGQLEVLHVRSPLIVLSGSTPPTDLAARAARCALALRRLLGGVPMALVTGRTEVADHLPVGALIDRAVQLLARSQDRRDPGLTRIDDVTAGLLGARFETIRDEVGYWLRAARDDQDTTPQLLGKPTACVGRERELALLDAEIRHCIAESEATAVLVTGAAGMGKSRLRQEIVRSVYARGGMMEVWIGQADPMSAGSAFNLLAQALRRGIGLIDGEPIGARRRKVQARVARHEGLDVPRVTTFLGELVGTPFPDEENQQLQAARRSPMVMRDQLLLAWQDFIQAECAEKPVLLVLEDLHWGDLPTVTMVDAALRHLKRLPLMVLALGRPEVHALFPKLWAGRREQEICLTPLPRRASERLVRQVLGDDVSPELLATLVQRADGNAFYLEEQLRAVASDNLEGLPETVLAMVQAGLETLDSEARRVLRAASIFGETFQQSGVSALVKGVQIAPKLLELVQREVLRRSGAGASGEIQYRFRHALVREAAYGMLTDHDRRLGHALAGNWLERTGDADPMALAEHFERGGEPARAATAYLRAAQQALQGDDLGAAVQRSERGIACGAVQATAGALRLVQAEAHRWRGEFALAEQRGLDAAEHFDPGSAAWFSAVTQRVIAAGRLGGHERIERWTTEVRDRVALEGGLGAKNLCLSEIAVQLIVGRRLALAEELMGVLEDAMAGSSVLDREVVARLHHARALQGEVLGDPGIILEQTRAALAAFEQASDRRNACLARANLGYIYGELGDFEGAEAELRAALSAAERMGLHDVVAGTHQNLGPVLAQRGQMEEARTIEDTSATMYQRLGDPRMEGFSRIYLAKILLLAGSLDAAEHEAATAEGLLRSAPSCRAHAMAARARALAALGHRGAAEAAASEAVSLQEAADPDEGEGFIHLVHAELLAEGGRNVEAAVAIAEARERLLARAAKISDPVWRERFLQRVADNARTLELARRWLGDGRRDEGRAGRPAP